MIDDDDDFVSAMYGRDDEDEDEAQDVGGGEKKPTGGIKSNGLTVHIRQGFYSVEVPSLAYVRKLEDIIGQQTRKAISQERAIRKLAKELDTLRNAIRRQDGDNRDIRRELDRKIDGNDW